MKNTSIFHALKESEQGKQIIIQAKRSLFREKIAKNFRQINDLFWNTWVTSANTQKGIEKDFSWRKAVYKEIKNSKAYRQIVLDATKGKTELFNRFQSRLKAHDFKGAFELVS